MTNSPERLTLTVKEAAMLLGININSMYQLVKSKDFPVIVVGRRILIPKKLFESWIENQAKKLSKYLGV